MPNVVFITSHDLGRNLGCYGRRSINSPHLDELAKRGFLFQNSFCTTPLCSPSRAALHTGRYAHSNGVMGLSHAPFNWRLRQGEKHVAQRLRESGYETALIGIQHLTNRPMDLGYESVSLPRGSARQIGEAAARFLESKQHSNKPFYLEVGFFEPHRPYNWGATPPDTSKGVIIPPYIPDTPEARHEFAALQGAIHAMDGGVGTVLTALQELGMEQDTWVIFTTDHGVAMPGAKSTVYEPGIEAALIMYWPEAGLHGGHFLSEITSNVDIVPTLLEGLGMPIPSEVQGRSFWPLLQRKKYAPRQEIFAEKTYHTYYEPMRCIRTPNYKLIVNLEVSSQIDIPNDIRKSPIYPQMLDVIAKGRVTIELYDLVIDPQEETNLAGQPEVFEVEANLRKRLLQWMKETNDPILNGPIPSPYYENALRWLLQDEEK